MKNQDGKTKCIFGHVRDVAAIKYMSKLRKENSVIMKKVELKNAIVDSIQPNTFKGKTIVLVLSDKLQKDEGLLIGTYEHGLFLIGSKEQSDVLNAGCYSEYILMAYMNFQNLGDVVVNQEVLAVNCKGEARSIRVCDIKNKKHGMTLVSSTFALEDKTPIKTVEDIEHFIKYKNIYTFYKSDTSEQIKNIAELKDYTNKPLQIKIAQSTFLNGDTFLDIDSKLLSEEKLKVGTECLIYASKPKLHEMINKKILWLK